ncbi:MAG: zinc ribbon domain-containing protein [Planctomycetota bacterium]|jgi:hypothetical protein
MRCPNCDSENLEGSRFCAFCSKELPQTIKCSSCQGEILQESTFCPFCASRLDQEKGFGRSEGSLYNKGNKGAPSLPGPLQDAAPMGQTEVDDKGGTTTLFCNICNEPTASDKLIFDIDGNRVCKKCMETGGRKKSAKTRRIEALKLQVEGKTATPTNIRPAAPKVATTQMRRTDSSGSGFGRTIALVFGVLILLGGLGAGFYYYYFEIYEKQMQKNGGNGGKPSKGKGPSKSPAKKGGAQDPNRKGEIIETPENPPPVIPSNTPQWFRGVFRGVSTEEGILSGALRFESDTYGIVFVTLPPGAKAIARTYVKGKKYKFKFKPDSKFHTHRRVTFSMLEGPIQSAE